MPALGLESGLVNSPIRGAIAGGSRRALRRNPVTARISREQCLYIYSVGCFTVPIYRASKGVLTVFGIPQDKALIAGDLTVSKPCVLEGIPSETYPSEGKPKWVDCEPPEGIGYKDEDGVEHFYCDEPGYYEALVTIGAGPLSAKEHDQRPRGLFVSKFPEQKRPVPPNETASDAGVREIMAYERLRETYEDDLKLFDRWKAQVMEAQENFRQYCRDTVQSGNEALSSGLWSAIKAGPGNGEPFITCARLLHYTEVEAPFLKDTVAVAARTPCISCGATVLAGYLKCSVCGDLQVSPKVYAAEIKKRQDARGD